MSVQTPDGNIAHLLPAFAALVKATLDQVNRETAGKFASVSHWILFEGFRSQARQDWLYAQGRTRPGPIVTHLRVSNHSSGMAADCYPVGHNGEPLWDAPDAVWAALGHAARSQKGLQWGGDFPKITGGTFVDQPHIEPNSAQRLAWKIAAAAFVGKLKV